MTEAFASWTPHRIVHLDAGAIRVPFSLTRQVDQADLRMPERAELANTLAPDFRVGGAVGGDFGALAYSVAVMSASRTLDGELFDRGALVARAHRGGADRPGGHHGPGGARPTIPGRTGSGSATASRSCTARCSSRKTIGAGMDASAQWRRFVATAEYIFMHAPSGDRQGAVVEPSVTLFARRLDLVARGEWQRAAGGNGWGGGAALTFYAPDPRARLQAGAERRTGPDPAGTATYALLRLTLAID